MLLNILRIHQGGRVQPPNPQDDLAIIKEQLLDGADEKCRNPSRVAKHQRDLLKDYFNHEGALPGQDERIR